MIEKDKGAEATKSEEPSVSRAQLRGASMALFSAIGWNECDKAERLLEEWGPGLLEEKVGSVSHWEHAIRLGKPKTIAALAKAGAWRRPRALYWDNVVGRRGGEHPLTSSMRLANNAKAHEVAEQIFLAASELEETELRPIASDHEFWGQAQVCASSEAMAVVLKKTQPEMGSTGWINS